MRILVLGATGFLGNTVARHLSAQGHQVTGLARSDAAEVRLAADGIKPLRGDLETDLAAIVAGVQDQDAVIFAPQLLQGPEQAAVAAFLDAMAGTGKSFLFTSGTGVLGQRTFGAWSEDTFAEEDEFVPAKALLQRVETEIWCAPPRHEGCAPW